MRARRHLPRAVLAVALLATAGCATKGDLRNVTLELRALSARQDSLLVALQRQALITQDSLRGTTSQLFEIRGTVNQQLTRIQEEIGILRQENAQLNRTLSAVRDQLERQARSGPPMGGGGDAPPTSSNSAATDLYNVALQQYNLGQFTTARMAFEQLVSQHPNDALAPEAQFKLAEMLEQEGRLRDALQSFERIPQLYPSAPRVPDALYRVGLIHIREGRRADARRVLQRVVDSYPDSSITPTARERLRELGPAR